jgi:hypothetical protein
MCLTVNHTNISNMTAASSVDASPAARSAPRLISKGRNAESGCALAETVDKSPTSHQVATGNASTSPAEASKETQLATVRLPSAI